LFQQASIIRSDGKRIQDRQENARGAQTKPMINRYRTFSTIGNRSLRRSLMLLSQGIARLGNGIGMILCGNGLSVFTHKPQGSNWLNTFAAMIAQDSPRYAYAYANVVVSDDSGEPSRAWSQGRRQTKGRIRP
jgi:hypothetical protein